MFKVVQFENSNVEVVIENNEPLFELYSVGAALGYSVVSKGKEYHRKERINKTIANADIKPVFHDGKLYLTEEMLYDFMLEAKTEKCKPFRKWLVGEVLPSIRKTGGYVNNDEMFIKTYLPYADENTKNLFRLQLNTIKQLNHKIETDKPLVSFAEQVSSTEDLIDIGTYSKLLQKKGLNMGRTHLFRWLRNNGYLRKNNEPYQQYINQGYFKTREYAYLAKGKPKVGIKTYITGKGQQYLFNKLSALEM